MPTTKEELAAIRAILEDRANVIDHYVTFKAQTELRLDRLSKVIDGNGKGSVPDRLTKIEEKLDTVEKDLDNIMARLNKASWWAITSLVAFLLTLLTILVRSNIIA